MLLRQIYKLSNEDFLMKKSVMLMEGFGAVLYKSSEKYRLFMSAPSHSGISFPAVETERGRNAESLGVGKLVTCGSVFYDGGEVICGAHGVNQSNLIEILNALNLTARNSYPEKVFLVSPKLKEYAPAVRKMFRNSDVVEVRRRSFSMSIQ